MVAKTPLARSYEILFESLSDETIAKLRLATTENEPDSVRFFCDSAITELLQKLGFEHVAFVWAEIRRKHY